jgi:hypothetical protein
LSKKVFISYSHQDKKYLDKLLTHLTLLKREGKISTWTDREIEAGEILDNQISGAQAACDIFIALVSPDFIASNYCYETEMNNALERAKSGGLIVVPIILEPCEWMETPLGKLKALPNDGKEISEWTNQNSAYLDIVTQLRKIIDTEENHLEVTGQKNKEANTSNYKIKRDFTSIDETNFRDDAFKKIRGYFESAVTEINEVGEIQAKFEDISATAFTATVVNLAKRETESHITVTNNKKKHHFSSGISISDQAHDDGNSSYNSVGVSHDEYSQFLTLDGYRANYSGYNEREKKLTTNEVAEILWSEFVERAGIEYV